MAQPKRPPKDKLWIYADPSVRLPYFLLRSNAFKRIGHPAKTLYILMRMSIGDTNFNPMRVRFGPQDAAGYMHKATYYEALAKLIEYGLIEEIEPGKSGRKGVYNLTTRRWVEV
jgi:hypothetical protein